MEKYNCKRCGRDFGSYKSLRIHVGRKHKIHSTDLYVEYHLNGMWPLCKCGCNQRVKWSGVLKNFRDYCQGHQSRVHNNWGHNPKAVEASSKTRKEQFKNGERTVWNIGLTKEIDERVKNNGIETSKSFTKERKKVYSKMMKENRLNGTTPTLYGSSSSQWKGGVSSIQCIVRGSNRLYKEWKYPILVRDGFKCTKCPNTIKLHIHHDKETMSEIIKKHVLDDIDVNNFELKKSIAEKVIDYHITNKVSGTTLCNECHNELHPSLNFVN